MAKEIINKEIYNNILDAIIKSGISNNIISFGKKMDVDVVRLFYEKILNNYSEENMSVVTKNLLGIYGNYFATYYFEKMGYDVHNECPITDKGGDVITKADLAFIDKNGYLNYAEVKATKQIISNGSSYIDMDNGVNKKEDILKYKNIGKKLLTQVDKLSLDGTKVNVVLFNDCNVDNQILETLKNKKVIVHTLSFDIQTLEDIIYESVKKVRKEIIDNTISFKRV